MQSKLNYTTPLIFTILICLIFNIETKAQRILNKTINKFERAVEKKIDKAVDNVLDGKPSTPENNKQDKILSTTDKGRPKFSELNDEDFLHNEENKELDEKDTRFPIAKNLMIDISGKYPKGYLPKWRFIGYPSALKFAREDWVNPTANLYYEDRTISIGDYGGKAVIRFKPHYNCECYADILIKDSFAVISEVPKIFEIGNFRKILNELSTGEPCIGGLGGSGAWRTQGGWGGKITLSANANGDILMDFVLEEYTAEHQKGKTVMPSQVNYRFRAKGTTVENEMSAQKAIAIIVAEKEEKQRQKDYMEKTTKQAEALQKLIAKNYPQINCKDCFYSSSGSYISTTQVDQYYVGSGNYAGSYTDWNLNVRTEIKNKCNYNLTFIGIQQMYSEERGYYLEEVTKTMDKGYHYRSDQGAMATIFTSLIGGGSEFNLKIQDKYYPTYASVGSVQWLKVIRGK